MRSCGVKCLSMGSLRAATLGNQPVIARRLQLESDHHQVAIAQLVRRAFKRIARRT
jgi:hypothetical protein